MRAHLYLLLSAAGIALGCGQGPQFTVPAGLVYLDQGPQWTAKAREVYYYTPQGTELHGLRYAWFVALEQATSRDLFAAPENLARYGFLFSPEQLQPGYEPPKYNPGNLPVGFTSHKDEATGDGVLDISCAACHTGQLEYEGTALRVDGGQAMHAVASTELNQFLPDAMEALVITYVDPFTFDRFAERVLGTRYPDAKPQLRAELRATIGATTREFWYIKLVRNLFSDDGYGRIDALGFIANTVFGDELDPRNDAIANAPVSYPHVWDIWKFDFVQWNASVAQPMSRNIGEALGVKARLDLLDRHGIALPKGEIYRSSALVREIDCIETTLWKLGPPIWNEQVLPKIDRDRAAQGKQLFEQHCVRCHGPQVYENGSLPDCKQAQPAPDGPVDFSCKVQPGELKPTPCKPIEWKMCVRTTEEIGTDPQVNVNFLNHRYDASALDPSQGFLRNVISGDALNFLVSAVIGNRYEAEGISPEKQWEMNGWGRKSVVRRVDGYKARPLHGVWATPPFLHNGSVRTLYELLSPVEQRAKAFYVGSKTFDPREVGYRNERLPWSLKFDTSDVGNHNTGHQFGNDGPGTIGPLLTPEQRLELIEYIKVLGNPAFADLDTRPAATGEEGSVDATSSGSKAPHAYASSHRTVEPFVTAGPWRCSADLQGAPSVIFGDAP